MLQRVILHWGLIHRTSMLRVAALCQGMPQGGGGEQAEPRRSHLSPRGRNSTKTLIMGLMMGGWQARHYGNVERGRL